MFNDRHYLNALFLMYDYLFTLLDTVLNDDETWSMPHKSYQKKKRDQECKAVNWEFH